MQSPVKAFAVLPRLGANAIKFLLVFLLAISFVLPALAAPDPQIAVGAASGQAGAAVILPAKAAEEAAISADDAAKLKQGFDALKWLLNEVGRCLEIAEPQIEAKTEMNAAFERIKTNLVKIYAMLATRTLAPREKSGVQCSGALVKVGDELECAVRLDAPLEERNWITPFTSRADLVETSPVLVDKGEITFSYTVRLVKDPEVTGPAILVTGISMEGQHTLTGVINLAPVGK